MKKFIFILVAAFTTVFQSYGQLQTKSTDEANGYKTVYKYWMGYGCIRYINGTYVLMGASTNQFENTMHSIILGDDKESAIQSLNDLRELKNNCPKELIVTGVNNKNTRIFKAAGCILFATDGVAGESNGLFYLNCDKAIKAIKDF